MYFLESFHVWPQDLIKNVFRNCSVIFFELTLVAGTKICQSMAIERFVAKYSGLYLDDPVAAAHVDAVLDHVGRLVALRHEINPGCWQKLPWILGEARRMCSHRYQGLTNSRSWDCARVCVFSRLHKNSKTQIRNPNTRRQSGALAQGLEKLERFLKQIGTEGYAVGNKHTIADTHVLTHLTFMGSGFWDGIPADFSNSFARITIVRR